jgi:hypothetical protein
VPEARPQLRPRERPFLCTLKPDPTLQPAPQVFRGVRLLEPDFQGSLPCKNESFSWHEHQITISLV